MEIFSKRREELLRRIDGNFAIALFSGRAPMRSEDEAYPFAVNRNFYYLTGLDREDMVLLMYRLDDVVRQALFIQPYDEELARWVGGRMSQEEAHAISGIEDVVDLSDLEDSLASLFNRARRDSNFKVYLDLWHYTFDQADTPASTLAKKLKDRYPYFEIADAYPQLTGMRLVKDEHEIECLRKAIQITDNGIRQMMRHCRPGLNEMAMEGAFEFVLKSNLCSETAFKTIAASGERATILHYSDNDHFMNDGELFLCDLGATFCHYNADISRTFPVNGRFTERQREIYDIVLQAQQIVKDNAKPGVGIRQLNQMVIDFYREELPKHGLDEDVREYYFHSCSHHLGLDTHDCDGGLGAVLQEGNVITNEPGLYIASEGIGIRIEDDLLIKADGAEVLSSQIIKDPDEIERFMDKGGH